jgi:lauroyl/myristoyl acyltransferase
LFSGNLDIRRVMRRFGEHRRYLGRNCATARFAYLNHYYAMRALYNYGWLLNAPLEEIRKEMAQMEIRGLGHAAKAVDMGGGILAFSAHVGCFFNLLFAEPVTRLCKVKQISVLSPGTSARRKQCMEAQLRRAAADLTWELVDIEKKSGGMKLLHTLRNKGVVACALDYAFPFTKNSVVKFLGRGVEFPIGAVVMGRRLGITFLPCFSYVEAGRTVLEFQAPFSFTHTDAPDRDITEMAVRINNIIETKIRAIPEQWSFWLRLVSQARTPDGRSDPECFEEG